MISNTFHKRFSSAITFSIILGISSSLNAQIIIKDTVIISPPQIIEQLEKPLSFSINQQFKVGETPQSNIRVELSWSNPSFTLVRIYAVTPYGEQVYYGSSSPIIHTFIVPRPGLYRIRPQVCGAEDTVTFTSKIYLNDSLIVQRSVTLNVGCCNIYCNVFGAEVEYYYNSPEHVKFKVVVDKDTISINQTTRVSAIALDTLDREVWIEPTTLLTYCLQPDTLGKFINVTGDTVPTPLNNVSYQDSREGRIRFLSHNIPPGFLKAVTIEVAQMNDTKKRGSNTVWVENVVNVFITRPVSTNVYPTYPGQNNSTTKKNWIDLELIVMASDSSHVPNYWVQIDKPILVESGGHSHDGARPKALYIVPKLTGPGIDTITSGARKTDSMGVMRFKFLASKFGGLEKIRAGLLNDTTRWDTLSIKTRVPGLVLLPENTNYYVKIGGTCKHHGPDDDAPSVCKTPDDNHWVDTSVAVWLDSVARIYKRVFNPPNNIKYNDISLPLGGGFDISGRWEADLVRGYGHQLHRVGKSVDVRTNPPNINGVPIGRKQWLQQKLRQFDRRATVDIHSEGTSNQHFHFQFSEE